jgi:hypothetical protein
LFFRVGHDRLVSSRKQVLKPLRERRGRTYTVLLSSDEAQTVSGGKLGPAFLPHREFSGAHPESAAKSAFQPGDLPFERHTAITMTEVWSWL